MNRKFKRKYKWSEREEHFRTADFVLKKLTAYKAPLLGSILFNHNRIEQSKTSGINNLFSWGTGLGEVSVIDNGSSDMSSPINML